MKIEAIKIKNYKVFQNAEAKDLSDLAVFIGQNGSGKSTFFDIFDFLHDCLRKNVGVALAKRGGYQNVVSCGHEGEDICFVIKFRLYQKKQLVSYELSIGLDERKFAVVNKEIILLQSDEKLSPYVVLQFSHGEGFAIAGKLHRDEDIYITERKNQQMDAPDILAIKGFGQFTNFEAINAVTKMIEGWHAPHFNTYACRERRFIEDGTQLTKTGDNISVVVKNIQDNYPDIFTKIIDVMKLFFPYIEKIETHTMQDGYILLSFKNKNFQNTLSIKSVSDGIVQLFMYLVLLFNPIKPTLLCIEEPESHIHHTLQAMLAEQFEMYSYDNQIFISTHSTDFLNAVPLDVIYCLENKNGFVVITRAIDNQIARDFCDIGDLPGALWRQGILMNDY